MLNTRDIVIDRIIDDTIGVSLACTLPAAAANAYIASQNAALVDALAARRQPIDAWAFAAPPPPTSPAPR